MGSDPSTLFPFAALKKQFKTHGIYAIPVASVSILVQTADERTIPDGTNKVLQSKEDNSYDRRVLELVTDLVDYGFI